MKRIRTIILISLFILVVFGSFIPEASAKFILGKALCNPSPEAIREAKTYDAFTIGQKIDLSPTEGLTKAMRVENTIGKVHSEAAVSSLFNFDIYLNEVRGMNQTAGKTFEESFRRSFNKTMTRRGGNYFAENTAILGKTHDSTDLLILEKKTNIVKLKVQQKLSYEEAIDAIFDVKYQDCIILIPSDQLQYLKDHLDEFRPEKRKKIVESIFVKKKFGSFNLCKLTDNVLGVRAKSKVYYHEATQRMYKRFFNKTSDEVITDLSRAIRNLDEIITKGNKVYKVSDLIKEYSIRKITNPKIINPQIESALRAARFAKFVKVGNRVVGVAGAIWDIGYGVYMFYDAESQFEKGLLDVDLSNYKKILGVVQIGVGVLGLVAVFSPDPFSKVATPVIIAVGVLVAALDMWIDHIQAQRIAARQRLIERLDAQDRPRAIREFLIKKMNTQCAL